MGVFLHLLEIQFGVLEDWSEQGFEVHIGPAHLLQSSREEVVRTCHQVPLLRFAGVPDRLVSKRLYLNFRGYKRNPRGMDPFEGEIVPAFQSVREKGLNMIDASQLHTMSVAAGASIHASGD